VARWVVLLDWVAVCDCVVEPCELSVVDLAVCPASCVVLLLFRAGALAEAVFDCRFVSLLPGLKIETGALTLAATPWTATAFPPVAVWLVVLLWLTRWVWVTELEWLAGAS